MKYSVKQFTHCGTGKYFCTEISNLNLPYPPPTITLVSDMGTEATFARVGAERCGTIDDEVLAWIYKPTAESLEACTRLKDYKLTIFND
jgi:hypothetical protein